MSYPYEMRSWEYFDLYKASATLVVSDPVRKAKSHSLIASDKYPRPATSRCACRS